MATPTALVNVNGRYQQIQAGDTLVVGTIGIATSAGSLTITPAGTDVIVGAGKNLSGAAGAGNVNFGSMTGTLSTPTGAATFNGSTNTFTNAIFANGGVDRSAAAALNLGVTNANAVNIGSVGVLTTILGDFQVDGAETVVGASTFVNNATFNGDVTFGDAATDTVSFISSIGPVATPNMHFIKEVNHTIDVNASTTAATAGGNLSMLSGAGNGAAAGNLILDTGTGTVGGTLAIGTANADAIAIGRTGKPATFSGAVTIPGTAANLLAINTIAYQWPTAQAAGQVLTTNGAGVLTWAAAASGTITGTGVANRFAYWTSATNISNDANLLWDPAGAAVINPTTTLTLGGTTTTAVAIGHSGITTTVTGGLTQLTGAVSLSANAASSFTTSAGALTITSAGTAVWSSAVQLTVSAAGGPLILTGSSAFSLSAGGASSVSVSAGGLMVFATGSTLSLGTAGDGTVAISQLTKTTTVGGGLTAPASNTTTNALTLNGLAYQFPTTQSAGQMLTTDGTGVLTWTTGAASSSTFTGTAGETIATGALLAAINSTGSKIVNADSDGAGNRVNALGFAVAGVAAAATVTVQDGGEFTVPDAQWDSVPTAADTGSMVFMSETGTTTTAGKVTLTAPTTSGSIVQKVGIVTFAGGAANTTRVDIQIGDGVLV